MIVKVNGKSNVKVTEELEKFPYFTLKCKLGEVLKERGIKMQELGDLTGIRVATISELISMKRSTINVPHLIVIAQTLRIDNISELFEFIMPPNTQEIFDQDKEIIEKASLLPDQEEILTVKRKQRSKKKPTSN